MSFSDGKLETYDYIVMYFAVRNEKGMLFNEEKKSSPEAICAMRLQETQKTEKNTM